MFRTGRALIFSSKVLAIYVLAIVMFVFKEWGKKFAMNRNQRSAKRERVPRSAINLAYESDADLQLLASRSTKGMSVDVSSSIMEESARRPTMNGDKESVEVGRSLAKSSGADPCDRPCESRADCRCRNCRALLNLTECGVCLESLQSNQIKSCPVCANVVCTGCAGRLSSCAFCRSGLPAERNRALERLVDRLVLPCKNSRSGCKILLDGESRFIHESLCNYSGICCPVGRGVCGWRGTVASVQSHLHNSHNLQPLRDHGISVEIHSFRNKARASDGRVYTVCLACHDQLFAVRVVLFQSRLRLCFTRLGHESPQALTTRSPPRYGVSVAIRAHAGRRLRGLVPFGKYDRESRELTVTCDNLYPQDGATTTTTTGDLHQAGCPHRVGHCRKDLVKIDLQVKRLEES